VILTGDCLDVMAGMEPESVDAVVTDPPYGLGFMGREWDDAKRLASVPPSALAPLPGTAEARGAYPKVGKGPAAVAFDGRAFQAWSQRWAEAAYRVAKPSAYLLAFGGTRTVHRMTVALEDAGWVIRDMLVWAYACLSDDTEVLTSEGWVPYHKASVGQLAASFDPDSGELRWAPIEAVHAYHHEGQMVDVGPQRVTLNHRVILDATTARVPRVPGVRNAVYPSVGLGEEGGRVLLFEPVQRHRAAAGSALSAGDARRLVGGVAGVLSPVDERPAQSGLEGRRYRVQEAWELLGGPLRAGAGVGTTDGPQGRLRHGAPAGHGGDLRLPPDPDGVREPREPRSDRQPPREPDALAGQPDAQAVRVGQVPGGDGYPDAGRLVVGYAGTVWCITVATGAFVARRNGIVFVTGNSGFPKSKASLKPAWEPIVMARKPGPLRELGIDACRIPTSDDLGVQPASRAPNRVLGKLDYNEGEDWSQHPAGRWPSNVILTDPIFDGGVEGVVGGGLAGDFTAGRYRREDETDGLYGFGGRYRDDNVYGDTGTYSRFFLIPKADRADREPVLTPDGHDRSKRFSTHPTVKPTDLMRHLVRLVTPTGGTVLDPFLGSGSTGIACELEGFPWIGIEREREYVEIAEARLNGVQKGLGLAV
jgi:DNA modification methylase